MYCLAAVCRDAADASDNKFEEDCKRHRANALRKVEADIISLLKCTTPYLLASTYGAVLAQLVYLRRALTSEAGKERIVISHCLQCSSWVGTTSKMSCFCANTAFQLHMHSVM